MIGEGDLGRLSKIGNREIVKGRVVCVIIGLISFIVFTALGAFVYIPLPFTPVPITLQTFFVLLAGAALGSRLGSLSQFGYVALGSLGLPIFAGALGGMACLVGPTGGYMIGFVLAAYVVGRLIGMRQNPSFVYITLAMAVGLMVIYLLGIVHLAFVLHCSIPRAVLLGMMPFITGDALKVIAAATIYSRSQRRFREIFP
jgi:biotin transport system substrate-specific component